MTDEAKRIVDDLRVLNDAAYGYHLNGEVLGLAVDSFEKIMKNAADLIEQLSAELEAAKHDLKYICVERNLSEACIICKHDPNEKPCGCFMRKAWEWRGLCENNSDMRGKGEHEQ